MENKRHHYNGLNDADVIANRNKFGSNVLTPPKEPSVWEMLKNCMHFWLLNVMLGMVVASVIVIVSLNILGYTLPANIWIGPIILSVLFVIIYLVAYLGGSWDKDARRFNMDSLFTILLTALVLSGSISFYQSVFGGETGLSPYFEPAGIAFAVLLATGVSHILESRNEKTFKALNEVNDETLVKVIRNNNVCQVERKDIVVGDIVILNAGEEIPADCILLESEGVNVDESTLNGESTPSYKTTNENEFDKDATYPSNRIFKGTIILVGNCIAQVEKVGDQTECGKVFIAAQVREGEETPLSRKLNGLAKIITTASYILAGLIIVGRLAVYFIQGNGGCSSTAEAVGLIKYLLDTVMIAVTLIVVAVPEGLPMAVTLSLAFNMRRLMEQNTLPRTMHACETMGAASVICSDKTGTLTQNQMQVADVFVPDCENMSLMEECIGANSTAHIDHSAPNRPKAIGSPTEGALLLWLESRGQNYIKIRESVDRLDRIPFSTDIKYMATVVYSNVKNKRLLYVTGAPEILLSMCEHTDVNMFTEKLVSYQNQAYRTLGIACSEIGEDDVIVDGKLKESVRLRMLGIFAISDPVRAEVPQAIKNCIDAGIKVKIITGDNAGTAKEIGRQVGLWADSDTDSNILMGVDVAAMSDEELKKRLPDVKIISRARPKDKERIVRSLRAMGEIVAVTGDGTNDAPALNAAHVGLSMGDGTSVAKESSDMTILDNSFSTISNAVMWGRSLYKNIKRFILFQMTVNVTACFIVLVGAFIGTDSPLTVTQMLWVNLIMDTFAALALASLPPNRAVMKEKPRSVEEHILVGIGRRILYVGIAFAIVCLAVLLYFRHNVVVSLSNIFPLTWGDFNGVSPHELGLFFTIFVMLNFWNLFNAKAYFTTESAFRGISWGKTRWFIIIVLVIFLVQILITEVPGLQEMFNIDKSGVGFVNWIIIFLMTSLVVWFGEIGRIVKRIRLFHRQES